MARCLVTGHKGYIGSKLFRKLQDLNHDVIGVDLNDKYSKDILKVLKEDNDGKFHPYYYNFQPEYIFHMACWPRVGYSVDHPVETTTNNVLAGSIVLNYAKKVKSVKRVIYSSSSSIVGNGDGPESPYALQKYFTELETILYSKLYNIDTVCLRYFNVYSRDQKVNGPYSTAVCNWMHAVRENINPYITGDGEQRRDFTHVDDIVDGMFLSMSKEFGTYELGSGVNYSINELANMFGEDYPKEYIEERVGEARETLCKKPDLLLVKNKK